MKIFHETASHRCPPTGPTTSIPPTRDADSVVRWQCDCGRIWDTTWTWAPMKGAVHQITLLVKTAPSDDRGVSGFLHNHLRLARQHR